MSRFFDARPLVLGHRGGRTTRTDDPWPPENTLAAFGRAIAEGADGIECDVRLARDGEVVVVHDPDLARVTGGDRSDPVSALSLSQLEQIALASGVEVPTLAAVFDWARAARSCVNVEIKYDVPSIRALATTVAELTRRTAVEVLVSSFDVRALAWFRTVDRSTPTAWLSARSQRWAPRAQRWLASSGSFPIVHLERPSSEDVAFFLRRGVRTGAWTVNDSESARKLFCAGIAWIVTDDSKAIALARSTVSAGATERARTYEHPAGGHP